MFYQNDSKGPSTNWEQHQCPPLPRHPNNTNVSSKRHTSHVLTFSWVNWVNLCQGTATLPGSSISFDLVSIPEGSQRIFRVYSRSLQEVVDCMDMYEYINTIEYWVSTLKRTKLTKFLQVRQKQTKNKVLGVHRWEESSSSRAMHRRIESSFGLASSIGTWPAFATVAEVDFGSAWAKASMSDAETIPSPSPATAMFERNGHKIGKTWEKSTEKYENTWNIPKENFLIQMI